MYKVLNKEWEKITVSTIDVTKHKHVSGRDFIKEDGFDKIVKIFTKKVEVKKETLDSKKK